MQTANEQETANERRTKTASVGHGPAARRSWIRWSAFGLVAVLLAASVGAVASVQDEIRPALRPDSTDRPQKDVYATPFKIALAGVGTDADNETYDVTLAGHGRARARITEDGLQSFQGIARVKGQVVDAEGDAVKASDGFAVKIRARADDNGTWHWQFVTRGETSFYGFPKLALRGTGTGPANGSLDMDAKGQAVFQRDDNDARLKLKLDVSGSVFRADAPDRPDRRVPISVRLAGVGIDADNASYDVSLGGKGKAVVLMRSDRMAGLHGIVRLNATVTDAANETVLQGVIVAKIDAKRSESDAGTWRLKSTNDRNADRAFLALRGTSDGPDEATLELKGAGKAVFIPDSGDARLHLTLEVHGLIARA